MHSLGFRGITAFFGHLGVEWNVLTLELNERHQLTEIIELHKQHRALLHSGDVVRFDPVLNGQVPASQAMGVYSADRREALVGHAQLTTGLSLAPPPLCLPGLLPDVRYRVTQITVPGSLLWWQQSGIELTGAQLAAHGIQLPRMNPESAMLLHLEAL
jgi:alpha-galactosidase